MKCLQPCWLDSSRNWYFLIKFFFASESYVICIICNIICVKFKNSDLLYFKHKRNTFHRQGLFPHFLWKFFCEEFGTFSGFFKLLLTISRNCYSFMKFKINIYQIRPNCFFGNFNFLPIRSFHKSLRIFKAFLFTKHIYNTMHLVFHILSILVYDFFPTNCQFINSTWIKLSRLGV